MQFVRFTWFFCLCVLLVLTACRNPHAAREGQEPASRLDSISGTLPMTSSLLSADGYSVDSAYFCATHHYWKGYVMRTIDTLRLRAVLPIVAVPSNVETDDSLTVSIGKTIKVAALMLCPADSIDSVWVKVATNEYTAGWVRESELLQQAHPDSVISSFIIGFSDQRIVVALLLLGLVVFAFLLQSFRHEHFRLVHFNDIPSLYPTLLCLVVSGSAVLCASVQHFAPYTWSAYYFHPTLNPFSLPPALAVFVASIWAMLIVGIAVIDDVRKQPDVVNSISYLAGLAGVCMLVYLFFTFTTPYYIGYVCLPLYWLWAYHRHRCVGTTDYLCGQCGAPLPASRVCSRCGTKNV